MPYPPLDTEDDAQLISDIGGGAGCPASGFVRKCLSNTTCSSPNRSRSWYGRVLIFAISKTPVADQISGRMLSFSFALALALDSTHHIQGSISATLALVPRRDGGPGRMVSLGGSGAVATVVDQWKWKGTLSSASAFSIIFREGASPSVNGPADAGFEFRWYTYQTPAAFLRHSASAASGWNSASIAADGSVAGSVGDVLVAVGADAGGFNFRAVADKSAFVIDSGSDLVLQRGTGGE